MTVRAKDQTLDFVEVPLSSMTSGAVQLRVPATSGMSHSIERETKFRQLNVASLASEDVRGFEIAAHDIALMKVVQTS